MGLFDGVETDLTTVEEYSVGLPPGTYPMMVAAVTIEEKESGTYLVITYTVTEGPKTGKTHKEMQRLVLGAAQSDSDETALRFLKTRMLSLGIAPEDLNTVEASDLEGREVVITLAPQKNDPRYMQIARLDLLNPNNAVPSLPAAKKPAAAKSADDPFA